MATARMIPRRIPELSRVALALATLALPAASSALPEDDAQQVSSDDFASLRLALDSGEWVQKAYPDRPTCITQGTRVICGSEIRMQRAEDGSISKVTAVGTPARFEQKPAADQDVVHFSGLTLVFDNEARLLTIDGDAHFSQGANEMSHRHIEYHLDKRTLDVTGGDDDESRGSARFTPAPTNGN